MTVNCVRPLSILTLTALLWSNAAGAASTVTIGGKSVELPDDVAEEHQKLIDNIGIYDDPELDAYVRQVGERLLRDSEITKPTFSFTLLDSPVINAFALPGGLIYVNRGLLAYLDTEAELAGVLAHEIGHITERHHSRRKTASFTSRLRPYPPTSSPGQVMFTMQRACTAPRSSRVSAAIWN